MKTLSRKNALVIMVIVFGGITSCTQKVRDASGDYVKSISQSKYDCDAMNNPDKFAWDVFIEISKPVNPNNPDGEIVWQKEWVNAEDVFKDPMNKPEWSKIVGLPLLRDNSIGAPLQQELFKEALNKMKASNPKSANFHSISSCKENMPHDSLLRNETKMNKATFDFIIENDMYYAEGVEEFFAKKTKIDAPIESKEIKATWKPIKPEDKTRYHFVEKGKKIYGLVALHIITKDLPNWTWATFEHIDNECLTDAENNPKLKSIDKYGRNSDGSVSKELKNDFIKNGLPEKWYEYYRLRGTQTDFTSPTGEDIILANTYIESGFELTSSCMTCHAKASVGAKLTRQQLPPNLKPEKISDYLNQLDVFETKEPIAIGNLGSPKPTWFYNYLPSDQKEVKYIQTDFMWSIPLRVKRKVKYEVNK